MSEKLKNEAKPKGDTERRAPIEFVAPYPLEECRNLLRETRDMNEGGFLAAGIEPTFEKVDANTVKFYLRRMRYDTRYKRWSSQVEIRGYLTEVDALSTAVIGTIYITLATKLLLALFVVLGGVMLAFTLTEKAPNLVGAGVAGIRRSPYVAQPA